MSDPNWAATPISATDPVSDLAVTLISVTDPVTDPDPDSDATPISATDTSTPAKTRSTACAQQYKNKRQATALGWYSQSEDVDSFAVVVGAV
jgi:hypothetical protein